MKIRICIYSFATTKGKVTASTITRGSLAMHLIPKWPIFKYSFVSKPLWPRSRLNILLNFTFESEAIRANLHFGRRCI